MSKDSVKSHKRFEEKYGLPFTLLSDPEKEVIQAYDVWKEKKNYGKVSIGVVRTTYLIDEQGVIVKAFDKVKAADNPAQMLGALERNKKHHFTGREDPGRTDEYPSFHRPGKAEISLIRIGSETI